MYVGCQTDLQIKELTSSLIHMHQLTVDLELVSK